MIKRFFYFLLLIVQQKSLIFSLAKREVRTQYVGSLVGFVWTFINPMVMIFVFWVVFDIGFRVQPVKGAPFVVWLTAGMAAWFAFADIVNGSARVIASNAPLIKKTLFHSEILPVVKLVSCLITHSIFLVVLGVLIIFLRPSFSFYFFQFFYYLLCMCVLALGVSWAVSSLNVFVRDIGQIVAVVLQMGFWATPIFWDLGIMPPKLQSVFKLNPMFYIVQGYRESFLYFVPFWQHPYQTVYYWVVALSIFALGGLVFKKLKPDFADVL